MRERQLAGILDAGAFAPEVLRTLARLRREQAEAAIEILIEALDAVDGDPDLEPDADGEPSLGSLGGCLGLAWADQRSWASGFNDKSGEAEQDINDERQLDESDREPSLGSLDAEIDQRGWARGYENGNGESEEDGWRRPNAIRSSPNELETERQVANQAARQLAVVLARRNGYELAVDQPRPLPPSNLKPLVIGTAS